MPRSMDALRQANPRDTRGFAAAVDAADRAVKAKLVEAGSPGSRSAGHRGLRVALPAVAAAVVLAVAVAAAWSVGLWGSAAAVPSVDAASVDLVQAAAVTAAAADESGTATVTMTRGGQPWTSETIRWNGDDIAIIPDELPGGGRRSGGELRLVDGTMYGEGPDFVELGPVGSIDPDTGTTPEEVLAIVRDDTGGATLRRIVDAMGGRTTETLTDGTTRHTGTVPAGVIAPETGFKEGGQIRVLPFGYVAHDEAEDPNSPLDTTITVSRDGVISEIAVTWGAGASAWTYTVTYTDLGSTPAPEKPANAVPLRR